jgi:heme/copper-type cytochrome/quinol oxidase subunit 2
VKTAASAEIALAAAAFAVSLVACGSPTTQSPSMTSGTEPTSATVAADPPAPATPGTVIDINIADGTVTPINGQVEAKINTPIVLKVTSDVVDQLHVHSVPEYTFDVQARPDQTFEFTVTVPGQVDVELHDLNRKAVTVQVRP